MENGHKIRPFFMRKIIGSRNYRRWKCNCNGRNCNGRNCNGKRPHVILEANLFLIRSMSASCQMKASHMVFRKCYQALLVFEILYGEFDDVYTHKTHADEKISVDDTLKLQNKILSRK